MSGSNEQIVTDFCQSLTQGSLGFARYLDEDVYYLNVPLPPISGRKIALAFLQPFLEPPLMRRMEILHTVSCAGVVMNERLEHWVKDDLHIDLPVAGLFEIRDGRIVSWKGYFDLPTAQPLLDAVMGRTRPLPRRFASTLQPMPRKQQITLRIHAEGILKTGRRTRFKKVGSEGCVPAWHTSTYMYENYHDQCK